MKIIIYIGFLLVFCVCFGQSSNYTGNNLFWNNYSFILRYKKVEFYLTIILKLHLSKGLKFKVEMAIV